MIVPVRDEQARARAKGQARLTDTRCTGPRPRHRHSVYLESRPSRTQALRTCAHTHTGTVGPRGPLRPRGHRGVRVRVGAWRAGGHRLGEASESTPGESRLERLSQGLDVLESARGEWEALCLVQTREGPCLVQTREGLCLVQTREGLCLVHTTQALQGTGE